jgi:hypothetical protein
MSARAAMAGREQFCDREKSASYEEDDSPSAATGSGIEGSGLARGGQVIGGVGCFSNSLSSFLPFFAEPLTFASTSLSDDR